MIKVYIEQISSDFFFFSKVIRQVQEYQKLDFFRIIQML